MNTSQRIIKNIGFFFTGKTISYILHFLYFLYAARTLGAQSFGILSLAFAIVSMFSIFSDFGLRQTVTREIAKKRDLTGRYVNNVTAIKVFLSIFTLIGLIVFIHFMRYDILTKQVILIIGISIIFESFLHLFYAVFQAYERMEIESVGFTIKSGLLFAGLLFVMKRTPSVTSLAYLYTAITFLMLLYGIFAVMYMKIRVGFSIDWPFWKSVIREAIPFGLAGVFGMLYNWIDTVMLSVMRGNEVVGWYNVAYRFCLFFLLVPVAFHMAVFPVLSRFHATLKNSFTSVSEKYFVYLTIISIPIAIGIMLLSNRIIGLFYGSEYINSCMGSPFSDVLSSTNRQYTLAKIIGIAVIVNVLLNLVFIPQYGYIAASATTVISVLVILTGTMIATARIGYGLHYKKIASVIIKSGIAGIIMGLFIVFTQKQFNLFLIITVSAFLYTICVFLLKLVDKEDMQIMKTIFLRYTET